MPRPVLLTFLALPLAGLLAAQETATPNDVRDVRAEAVAITGAAIQVDPGTRVEGGTLLVRRGEVVAVEAGRQVPPGYVERDLAGRVVYPALIDLDTGYGVPDPEPRSPFSFSAAEVLASPREGPYNVNQAIRSEFSAGEAFAVDSEEAESYRKLGFGALLAYRADGIARGSGALVLTGDLPDNEAVLVDEASAHYSFDKGSSEQSYPISPMGAVALLRQTHLDAEWYSRQQPRPFVDLSLEAWLRHRSLPQVFAVRSWLALLRAAAVAGELGMEPIVRGAGDEYRRIDAVRESGVRLILPLDFPEPYDVEDPLDARSVTLAEMKHWELAPTNPGAVAAAGIPFAITSGGHEEFWKRLRRAVRHGLPEEEALAALTTVPASFLGVEDRLGSLTPGSVASFLVASGNLFDEETVLEELWVQGQRHELAEHPVDLRGTYRLEIAGAESYTLEVAGEPGKPEVSIPRPEAEDSDAPEGGEDEAQEPAGEGEEEEEESAEKIPVSLTVEEQLVTLAFSTEEDKPAIRLSGWIEEDTWRGRGQLGDGTWVDWTAIRQEAGVETATTEEPEEAGDEAGLADLGTVIFPFVAYGREVRPAPVDLLIQIATVWTNEGDGILEGADVRISGGKIVEVGQGLAADGSEVMDANGLHLTPGIIDEHSHIALLGVNDVATNSGMVRMADVVDSEDINIYRNLAGGVTAAQLLHGSANPIGGQSALVKFRWGALPREMLIEGADGFIKFALGENVKRSRMPASIRYPQSRMGVEQVFRDAFSAARDYRREWDAWEALPAAARQETAPLRRDLALEAMVEVLEGERFVTCHSYVQSEINMLMHVAEDFDFRVNTFTHILEGYKVADKMAAHGAGGSTFADWWAYKWEVRYAIPYNPVLMSQAGVTVAVNSDSSEMSRRLNQEAAKSVKYGGMSEEEALKLVTLNPARLLHLEDRMGSIRAGKDADLVLWTANPLSIDAQVVRTLVDGVVEYDREADRRAREGILEERARLVEKMRRAKEKEGGGRKPGPHAPQRWECHSLHGYEHLSGGEAAGEEGR